MRTINGTLPDPDAVLEAFGADCATLTPLIKNRIRDMESGQVLEVRADDPAAHEGIAAWSRLTGNALLAAIEEEGLPTRVFLRKK